MKDVHLETGATVSARLVRSFNVEEARVRNALSSTQPGFSLAEGDVVTVVDRFDGGTSFLVEFRKSDLSAPDRCDWMGVVKSSDVELIGAVVEQR